MAECYDCGRNASACPCGRPKAETTDRKLLHDCLAFLRSSARHCDDREHTPWYDGLRHLILVVERQLGNISTRCDELEKALSEADADAMRWATIAQDHRQALLDARKFINTPTHARWPDAFAEVTERIDESLRAPDRIK